MFRDRKLSWLGCAYCCSINNVFNVPDVLLWIFYDHLKIASRLIWLTQKWGKQNTCIKDHQRKPYKIIKGLAVCLPPHDHPMAQQRTTSRNRPHRPQGIEATGLHFFGHELGREMWPSRWGKPVVTCWKNMKKPVPCYFYRCVSASYAEFWGFEISQWASYN